MVEFSRYSAAVFSEGKYRERSLNEDSWIATETLWLLSMALLL